LSGAPRISVILVTDHYRTIRRVLARLREQTALGEIELVVVLPSHARDPEIESTLTGFSGVTYVELETIHPIPRARAEGIRAASARVIFLGETHSFPNRELAEALIAAHESDWDAVVRVELGEFSDGLRNLARNTTSGTNRWWPNLECRVSEITVDGRG
jgi:hypothetical protein